jgi:hypothetical protein
MMLNDKEIAELSALIGDIPFRYAAPIASYLQQLLIAEQHRSLMAGRPAKVDDADHGNAGAKGE